MTLGHKLDMHPALWKQSPVDDHLTTPTAPPTFAFHTTAQEKALEG